jgi:membrane protein DedA with SNARE-associated domain
MEAFVLHNITTLTYSGIFLFLMLTVFGFPFPEDAVLLISGAMVSHGIIRIVPALCVSYVGVVTGDLILYYIGRRYGILIVKHHRFRRIINETLMKRAGRWFHKWGYLMVFFGRHLIGVRAQVFLCAGIFKLSARRVILYDSLSAMIGVPAMIFLGYFFGSNFHTLNDRVAFWQWTAVLVVIALALAFFVFRRLRRKNA